MIRYYRHPTGFRDGTDYVMCDEHDLWYAVDVDGTLYPLGHRYDWHRIARESWIEIDTFDKWVQEVRDEAANR